MLDSDDDEPLGAKLAKKTNGVAAKSKKRPSNGVKKEESDSDVPIAKKKKTASAAKPAAKTASKTAAKPAAKPAAKAARPSLKGGSAKATAASPKKNGVKDVKKETNGDGEEEEEEEEYRWWDQPKKEDDSIKWNTLEHNGVVFPPPYQPLPSHVHLHYDGTQLHLHEEAEESPRSTALCST